MDRDTPISVAIADDHPIVLQGLEALIDGQADMEVVATARDGDEAVRRVLATRPDVVVLDARMPNGDGAEATRRILADHPEARIIVLSGEDGETVLDALRAGACGYLSKATIVDSLVDGIRDAMHGRPVVGGEILDGLLDALRDGPAQPAQGGLRPKERRLMELVAAGRTNDQIAKELIVSVSTVKAQLAGVYERLGASDRASALAICFRNGWVE
jgi:DNA-binding NarL/FixJ family response regulator